MISEHQDRKAVDRWFTARVRVVVAAIGALGGVAVVASAVLTIASHV